MNKSGSFQFQVIFINSLTQRLKVIFFIHGYILSQIFFQAVFQWQPLHGLYQQVCMQKVCRFLKVNFVSCQFPEIVEISKHLKVAILCDPAVQLLGICPMDLTSYSTESYSVMSIAALHTITKKLKLPKCSWTEKQMVKIWSITQ